jgi:hypothetical protein
VECPSDVDVTRLSDFLDGKVDEEEDMASPETYDDVEFYSEDSEQSDDDQLLSHSSLLDRDLDVEARLGGIESDPED